MDAGTQTRGRRYRLLVMMLIAAALASLGAWAFSSPIGASPDDDFHLASIWCGLGDRAGLCEASPRPGYKLIQSGLNKSACYAMDASISAGCQEALGVFTQSALIESSRGSFSSNYPPVYYATMSLLASSNIQASVLAMRILNIVLFIISVGLLAWLLPKRYSRSLYWLWAITLVPLGMSLISSNNPSSWALIGVGTSWLALYGYFTSSGWRRNALAAFFAVEVLMASGARADAALYTVLTSAIAIVLSWTSVRARLTQLWLPAAAAVMSLAFYFGSQQSTIAATGLTDSETGIQARGALEVFGFNIVQLPTLWVGVFGTWGLGWLDTTMPGLVWVTSATVFVALVTVAWAKLSNRQWWSLIVLAGVLYALPLYVLQKGLNHVGEQVQPRYILPLVIVFAGVALLDINSSEIRMSRLQPWLYIAGLSVANAVALYVNTKRYVSGLENGSGFSLTSGIQWWWSIPVGPFVVWLIGALSFAVMLAIGYRLTRFRAESSTLS